MPLQRARFWKEGSGKPNPEKTRPRQASQGYPRTSTLLPGFFFRSKNYAGRLLLYHPREVDQVVRAPIELLAQIAEIVIRPTNQTVSVSRGFRALLEKLRGFVKCPCNGLGKL